MKHNIEKYLEDIRLSIEDIEGYVKDVTTANQIETNQMLFDAISRRFAIIGEALYQANNIDRKIAVTDKSKIIGLRHIIVHDYDKVKAPELWIIIREKLSILKEEIVALLKEKEE